MVNFEACESGLAALGNGGNGCVLEEKVVLNRPGLIASKEKLTGESASEDCRCIDASLVKVEELR